MTSGHVIITIPSRAAAWTGNALQMAGCVMMAANVGASGWAFVPMLAGSLIWLSIAAARDHDELAVLNLFFVAINCLGIWRWLL